MGNKRHDPIKFLILEDNLADAELIQRMLQKINKNYDTTVAHDKTQFIYLLENYMPDIILSDFSLRQFNGLEALEIVKQKYPDIPFIIVTGTLDEERAVMCLKEGAWDYVLKHKLFKLKPAIERALEVHKKILEKRKTEKDLLESENKLRNIIENSTNLFYTHSVDHKITFVSPQVREILGCEPEEAMKRWTDFATDNPINEKGFKLTEKAIKIGKRQPIYELELQRKDGRKIIVEVRESPIVENGKVVSIVGSLADITERKKAEEALKESEERFKKLSNLTFEGILIHDNGVVVDANQSLLDLFGYTLEEVIGKNMLELAIPKEFHKEIFGYFQSKIVEPYQIEAVKKDCTRFPIEVIAKEVMIKGKSHRVAAIRDITEKKKAEEVLEQSKRSYEAIYNNSTDCIFIHDGKTGEIVDVNQATLDVFGYTKDEIRKLNVGDLSLNEPPYTQKEAVQFIRRAVKEGAQYFEWLAKKKNGELIWFENSLKFAEIAGEQQVLVIGRDISDRKKAEKELKKAQMFADKIAETTPALLYIYDHQKSKNIWTNEVHKNYFKKLVKSYPEMHYKNVVEVIHKDDFARVLEETEKLNSDQQLDRFSLDIRIKSTGKDWKWMTLITSAFKRDENGKLLQTIGALFDITERKKVEEDLRESEERYERVVNYTNDVLYSLSPQGKIEFISPKIKKYGYSKEDILGKRFETFVHKEDANIIGAQFMETLKTGKIFPPVSFRILKKDKSIAYVEEDGSPIKDSEGRIIGITGVLRDVTERKKAEKEFFEVSERLELAMDAGEHGFWDWNLDTNDVYFSPCYYRMLGYETGELPMKLETWVKLLHPDDRKTIVSKVENYVKKAQPYEVEFRLKTKDGDWRWIAGRGKSYQKDKDGVPHRAVGVHVDITERKQAEEELKQSEERFKTLSNLTFEGILIHDNGVVIDTNQSLMEMFGYSRDEVVGKSIFQLAIPNEFHEEIFGYFKSKSVDPYQIEAVKKDGTRLPIEIVAKDVIIDNKKLRVAAIRDITERKVAEEKIEKELRENRLLLSEIHHRVKNNLQTLSGLLQLQQDLIETKEDAIKAFEASQDRIMAMARAYELLLHSEHMSDVNVPEYIESIVRQLKFSYDPESRVFVDYYLDNCEMEIQELSKTGLIINELVSNAFKYAFQGREQGRLELSVYEKNNIIYFEIADDGVGLPKDIDFEGTETLGLSLVSMMIKELKGKFTYNVDKGTRFIIEIPKGTKKQIRR
ncbi:MAG: PAS domain S-box protein [Candidatus Cloacimonetes bacterium]|nr:PAS domain S-box protein [Candidatus Cloacimonadota bacterium]